MVSGTDGVHSSVTAIQDMEAAVARFARAVIEQLPEVERELRQVIEALEDRRTNLRGEIASLEGSQSSSYDNSSYDDDDRAAQRCRLAEAEEELASVERRIRRLEETRAAYMKQARTIHNLATSHTIQAREFLSGASEDLKAYLEKQNDTTTSQTSLHGASAGWNSNNLLSNIQNMGVFTSADVQALKALLRKSDPVSSKEQIKEIWVSGADYDKAFVESIVVEYLQMVPPSIARNLPMLRIDVLHPDTDIDTNKPLWRGKYIGNGHLLISNLLTEKAARSTIFHELTHWIHLEGPQWYRDEIRRHFEARTVREPLVQLKGYARGTLGKLDSWWEPYAGRVYVDDSKIPLGAEIPTIYMQTFANLPDNQLADSLNVPLFRETMLITLKIFLTK